MPADTQSEGPRGIVDLHALVSQALAQRAVPIDETDRKRVLRSLERLQGAAQSALACCARHGDEPKAHGFIDHLKKLSA